MIPRMKSHLNKLATITAVALLVLSSSVVARPAKDRDASPTAAVSNVTGLWNNPTDIQSRDLFYGAGGKDHAPLTKFTFVKEDLEGTNPKFDVRDEAGTKWKAKLGVEARPEVVASRLVWAVGYYTNEDYFVPEMHVDDMPRLKRGQNLVGADGTVRNVRLKRASSGEKKTGIWKWGDNPFTSQRELNGLRVMMALVNNWDLKDSNNAIYESKKEEGADAREARYLVSDLGASFGTTGRGWSHEVSKGNLKSFQHSKFITKVTPEYVDFSTPSAPNPIFVLTPKEYFSRVGMRRIGRHIPRSDARWIGSLLAELSLDQIRNAFRAADYPPAQIEGFAAVLEKRIAELKSL